MSRSAPRAPSGSGRKYNGGGNVEILNTVQTGGHFVDLLACLVFGLAAVFLFLLLGYAIKERALAPGFLFLIVAALISSATVAAGMIYAGVGPVKHEVIITDMSKFDTDKYEIVEQRGKIFVVQEIEQ